ncbi:peptide chain release factor N(5)-glutamine methyltransferase [Joostella sp. CR20]|uniref:peptide chain release factor N(5)-glutamine methyltransferase n=1 Tax=Joostella sp. CR20 TaxID=2804312 RepID=UPI00313D6CCA
MKLGLIKKFFHIELNEIYPSEEIDTFFNWLCEDYLGYKPHQIQQFLEEDVSSEVGYKFDSALGDLVNERPIQYIIGKSYFYGLDFRVNEHTLIPRPETEELVSWIINDIDKDSVTRVLDIGTGTGCIPISIAKNLPRTKLFAVDISYEALQTASLNAEDQGVNINFYQQDILKANDLETIFEELPTFDVIVSNPPYVRNLEKTEIKNNVLNYEPSSALFVEDDDALVFYEKIAGLASENLKEGGKLYFEINQYLGDEMLALMKKYNFENVILKKDLYGKDRMIMGQKPVISA